MRYPEIIEDSFHIILHEQTGITQIRLVAARLPLIKTIIIVRLIFIGNNKRGHAVFQAFLEHQQPARAPVSVIERVYLLKLRMKRQNIIKIGIFPGICRDEPVHFVRNIGGLCRLHIADIIGIFFIIPDNSFLGIRTQSACFKRFVDIFDVIPADIARKCVYYEVECTEVVHRFDDIIDSCGFNADRFVSKMYLVCSRLSLLPSIWLELYAKSTCSLLYMPPFMRCFFSSARTSVRILGIFTSVYPTLTKTSVSSRPPVIVSMA